MCVCFVDCVIALWFVCVVFFCFLAVCMCGWLFGLDVCVLPSARYLLFLVLHARVRVFVRPVGCAHVWV